MDASAGAACRSASTSCARATASGSSTSAGAARSPQTLAARCSRRRSTPACRSPTRRSTCIQQHVDRLRRRGLLSDARPIARRCCDFLKPRPGLYARLSEMHDCGLLGRMFPEFQAISLPRGPRLLPQVHRRRAHAADDPEPRTAGRPLDRAARAVRLAARRPRTSPELLVLALLFHDVGKWRDENHAVESVRMAQAHVRAPAAAGRVARRRSSSSSSSTCRCRWSRSAATPRIRRSSAQFARSGRHRRAAEDAVPDDARRRRGGQSGNADAVARGAAVAPLRRHLQPPDARLRRRA